MKVRKAIIPAAGFATRMLPASKSIPKGMLPIFDKPILHYIIQEIVDSGIRDVLIIASNDKGTIQDYFDVSYELEEYLKNKNHQLYEELKRLSELCNIHCVRQKEKRGLGDAVSYAESFVGNEPFAVLLGDDIVYTEKDQAPCLKQMMELYEREKRSVIGIQRVAWEDVDRYGIVYGNDMDKKYFEIQNMEEKPDKKTARSNCAISGRYIINPEIFSILKETKPGKGNEIQLTDALEVLRRREGMFAYEFSGVRYDVGNKLGYIKASVEFALRDDKLKTEFMQYLKDLTLKGELL